MVFGASGFGGLAGFSVAAEPAGFPAWGWLVLGGGLIALGVIGSRPGVVAAAVFRAGAGPALVVLGIGVGAVALPASLPGVGRWASVVLTEMRLVAPGVVVPAWLGVVVAAVAGRLLAGLVLVWWRGARNGASGRESSARLDPAMAAGMLGEARVAAELARLGLPALRDVILRVDGRTVEIDHLALVADGIVVVETKAWAGFVTGDPDGPYWTRQRADGGGVRLRNPALQNLAHVRAVERVIADPAVRVHGVVVSAGRARFAPAIERIPVPLGELARVLRADVAMAPRGAEARLARAWARLEAEAGRSAFRRAAHAAYARACRRASGGDD